MKHPDLKTIDSVRKKGFRPQTVGCFLFEKRILFVYSKEHDLWQLPQGGIDNNEEVITALTREMSEELGQDFTLLSKTNPELILEDAMEFPPETRGTRELRMDDGSDVFMRGKHYYFLASSVSEPDFRAEQSEFDDAKWMNLEEAMEYVESMNQRGKRRITKRLLKTLKSKGLL